MNWQELHQHFDQTFDFFDRIDVSNSPLQRGVSIHPLIKLSTGLALKTMSHAKNNRLVILLPNRLESARWIATLCALEVMRSDYKANFSGKMEFSQGQKLLVNNRVVEFDQREYFPDEKIWKIWVRCSNGRWAIPLDRQLEFQPTKTKKHLSTVRSVSQAYHSSQRIDSQLDLLLVIDTKGNRSIFQDNIILVSKLGETTHFIQENLINGSRITDLFQWGKLDVYGSITPLASGQLEVKPSSLIVSDLFGGAEYIVRQSKNTKGVIVDGVASCVKDLPRLDNNILHLNIPTIVIADLFETELLHHLEERDFKIWQWNKNNLSQSRSVITINKETPFASLNHSLSNYTRQQIILEACEHPQLSELVDSILELGKAINTEDNQLQNLYSQLIKLVNEFSRVIWLPDQTWVTNFLNRIQHLEEDFAKQKLWMIEDIAKVVDASLKTLAGLASNPLPDPNHKPDRLRNLLGQLSSSDISAIVVPTESDAEAARQYWQNQIHAQKFNKLHFLTASDLRNKGETLSLTQLIICGWLNHTRTYPLLHLHVAPKITVLLYPFEAKWFKNARRKWQKQNTYTIRARDFSSTLKFPENKLKFVDFTPEMPDPLPEKENFDIIDFELRVRRYRYASYVAIGGSRDEIVKAKTVVFTENRFAFITETHRLLVVTDLIRGKTQKGSIPRRDIDKLQVGDYVLFRESDRDIIREIADKSLAEQNSAHLREIASLWKIALQEQYRACGKDIEQLTLLLWDAGCERESSTIKNWLFDEGRIGPKDKKDIERIARVTQNNLLLEKLHEVEEATRRVRGVHLQAAGYITRKLLANLSEILDSELDSYTGIRPSMVLDLDDFGQIKILRVEEILNEWKEYDINRVNRLLP